jgi:8-oxo-dGTP pyrophosphatase MutT (NUDIX family)
VNDLYILTGRALYWVFWPLNWLYLRWSHRTRLLVTYGDEILVVRNWIGDGRYYLPGGGLHIGEEPAKGAVRELFEETGATLHEDEIHEIGTETYHNNGFRFECHYFAFRSHARLVTKLSRLEIVEIAWTKRSTVNIYTHGPDVLRAVVLLEATN